MDGTVETQIIDVDASDIQGLSFLSLVAAEDTLRAGKFLEDMATPERIVLENIKFLANPISDTNSAVGRVGNMTQMERPVRRTVMVELVGAGSDDGAIVLFQLNQPQPFESRAMPSSDGYMSLKNIISSDPETSDVSSAWRTESIGYRLFH
ncbi:hypothetical protein H4S08_003868 [Coemansia sp. RSA 1365]|nr:hypothetical protein H4S08_003868 [Coemansia sp. RSA 1365]